MAVRFRKMKNRSGSLQKPQAFQNKPKNKMTICPLIWTQHTAPESFVKIPATIPNHADQKQIRTAPVSSRFDPTPVSGSPTASIYCRLFFSFFDFLSFFDFFSFLSFLSFLPSFLSFLSSFFTFSPSFFTFSPFFFSFLSLSFLSFFFFSFNLSLIFSLAQFEKI